MSSSKTAADLASALAGCAQAEEFDGLAALLPAYSQKVCEDPTAESLALAIQAMQQLRADLISARSHMAHQLDRMTKLTAYSSSDASANSWEIEL